MGVGGKALFCIWITGIHPHTFTIIYCYRKLVPVVQVIPARVSLLVCWTLNSKTKGEKKVFMYDDKMVAMRYFDRKALTMLSTVYSCIDVDTGRKHWKTKEVVKKPSVIVEYNKKMGGVDCNDQLLKYSAFSRRTLKWWKKVFFRLLNLAMVNFFFLYLEWLKINSKKPVNQNDFRVAVIKQLLGTTIQDRNIRHVAPDNSEFARLTGRHFIQKIKSDKVKRRGCKVCVPAERLMNSRAGVKVR